MVLPPSLKNDGFIYSHLNTFCKWVTQFFILINVVMKQIFMFWQASHHDVPLNGQMSEVFLQRVTRIVNYYVKEFVIESQ